SGWLARTFARHKSFKLSVLCRPGLRACHEGWGFGLGLIRPQRHKHAEGRGPHAAVPTVCREKDARRERRGATIKGCGTRGPLCWRVSCRAPDLTNAARLPR